MMSCSLAVRYFRFQISAAVACAQAKNHPSFGKISYFHNRLKLYSLKSQLLQSAPRFSRGKFVFQRIGQYAKISCHSGSKVSIRSIAVCSAIGSMSLWPRIAYCSADSHMLSDHHQTKLWPGPRSEGCLARIGRFLWKLLWTFELLFCLWIKWYRCDPLFAAKVAVVFLCTKPIPSSVHIFVDQLQRKIMKKQPSLYRLQPLHEYKVELEDYILVWLARVRVKDEKLLLIGFLDSWWVSPLSSSWSDGFLFDTFAWKELISSLKSRLRLQQSCNHVYIEL